MQKVIMLSEKEYAELLEIKTEPDALLVKTAENYKNKYDNIMKELEAIKDEMLKYAIAGVPKKHKSVIIKVDKNVITELPIEEIRAVVKKKKSWTKDDDVLLYQSVSNKIKIKDIVIDRTYDSITSRARKLGLFVNNGYLSKYKGK